VSKIISNLEKYTKQRIPPKEELEETVSVTIQPPVEKTKSVTPIWMAIGFAMTVVIVISVSVYLLAIVESLQQKMNTDEAAINQLNTQITGLSSNLQDRSEEVGLLKKGATQKAVIIASLEDQVLALSGRVADQRAELETLKLTLASQNAARAKLLEETAAPVGTEGL
jgi:low affinity Fe/Cu permease